MCGLVAISAPAGRQLDIVPALESIRHRGPDASGTFVADDHTAYLGHVRLAIIDVSDAGKQPMTDAAGRFRIVYNGEVYNFRELRARLDRDYGPIRWRSGSDTEVILEGYAREGSRFLDGLNGIFAMAIHDSVTGTVSVLRDPLGIKPLFVTRQGGVAVFCSELKGFSTLPGLKRTLRRQSLADQLAYMYVPEPHTLFEEVTKVEPGILFHYRQGQPVGSEKLFSWLRDVIPLGSEGEILEAFAECFSAAVRRQVIADVPLSLMLSGGLDSSAVAFEAVRSGAAIRNAYTIAFDRRDMAMDGQGDDLAHARMMAGRLGLDLEVIPASSDFLDLLPALASYMEDGISDPAAINTWLICKAARDNGVKVMLTGQGADEYLGGYRRYLARALLTGLPPVARRLIGVAGRVLPSSLPGRFNAVVRRARRFADLASMSSSKSLLGMYTWARPEDVSALFRQGGIEPVGSQMLDLFESLGGGNEIERMMRVDHHFDLMSLNLTYTDRMSMAVGVEARVPFLDFELVRIMNSLPIDAKIRQGTGKYVLKKVMEPHLPRSIVYREKAGFGLPLRAWMRKGHELVDHYLAPDRIAREGLFDVHAVARLRKECEGGSGDHASLLFSLLCIQVSLDRLGSSANTAFAE